MSSTPVRSKILTVRDVHTIHLDAARSYGGLPFRPLSCAARVQSRAQCADSLVLRSENGISAFSMDCLCLHSGSCVCVTFDYQQTGRGPLSHHIWGRFQRIHLVLIVLCILCRLCFRRLTSRLLRVSSFSCLFTNRKHWRHLSNATF